MTYKTKIFKPTPTVIYNPSETQRLWGVDTDTLSANITPAGQRKLVLAGTLLGTDYKLLKRAQLIANAAQGATNIYVNNPWAFAVGDALRVIASPGQTPAQELAAVSGATGASLGTIAAIDTGIAAQVSRLEIVAPIVGNIINLNYNGLTSSYTIGSTVVATEVLGLCASLFKLFSSSEATRQIGVENMGTYAKIQGSESDGIIDLTASLSQGNGASLGAIAWAVDSGIGRITLSAGLPSALAHATKIGVVTQRPLGIFDTDYDFTDYPQSVYPEQGITPVYGGQIYSDALPYLDGDIVNSLNGCAFIPTYA